MTTGNPLPMPSIRQGNIKIVSACVCTTSDFSERAAPAWVQAVGRWGLNRWRKCDASPALPFVVESPTLSPLRPASKPSLKLRPSILLPDHQGDAQTLTILLLCSLRGYELLRPASRFVPIAFRRWCRAYVTLSVPERSGSDFRALAWGATLNATSQLNRTHWPVQPFRHISKSAA